jgi:hypothetical protein
MAVAFTFLSEQEQAAWLATIDRTDPLLLAFARHLDELLEAAEDAGREMRPQDAAMALLKAAADEEAFQGCEERLAA